jgi:hypothetical protein
MTLPRTSALAMVLALGGLPIMAGAWAQSKLEAWTPQSARSPLRQIWSFDTKG